MSEKSPADKIQQLIYRSENPNVEPRKRTSERHKLIEYAARADEFALWLQVGNALVRACDKGELTTSISDKFVDSCKDDSVFRALGTHASPCEEFASWGKRTRQAFASAGSKQMIDDAMERPDD